MPTTATAAGPGTDQRLHAAARQLHDAECALHTAHQTHVDAWIAAANRKLAEAIVDHLAAAAEQRRSDRAARAPSSPDDPLLRPGCSASPARTATRGPCPAPMRRATRQAELLDDRARAA